MEEWETQYHNSMLQQFVGPTPHVSYQWLYLGIDDLQFLPFLEGQVLTCPLLIVKKSDEYGSLLGGT